jgi:hypothetical protein
MKNTIYTTPMLPGFHLQILRRKPRSEQQKLSEKLALLQQKSFKQIGEVFEKFIPKALLKPEKDGVMSRRRLFSKENTFWAFFSQILDADGGCKEVIRKLQAYASIKGIAFPSSSTASYCTARKKLDIQTLTDIFEHTASQQEQPAGDRRRWHWCEHAGHGQESGDLASIVRPKTGVRIPRGPYLCLFLADQRSLAQLCHGQQKKP